MKTMTCRQLGGGCDQKFCASTFEEIMQLSRAHCLEMIRAKDPEHLAAAARMRELMRDTDAMNAWFEVKRAEFDSLEHDILI